MKSKNQDFIGDLLIARHHWDVPLRVGLRPYVEFNHWLDAELQKLVARWAHTAAPNSTLRQRRKK